MQISKYELLFSFSKIIQFQGCEPAQLVPHFGSSACNTTNLPFKRVIHGLKTKSLVLLNFKSYFYLLQLKGYLIKIFICQNFIVTARYCFGGYITKYKVFIYKCIITFYEIASRILKINGKKQKGETKKENKFKLAKL